jgi:hypothetical protein
MKSKIDKVVRDDLEEWTRLKEPRPVVSIGKHSGGFFMVEHEAGFKPELDAYVEGYLDCEQKWLDRKEYDY